MKFGLKKLTAMLALTAMLVSSVPAAFAAAESASAETAAELMTETSAEEVAKNYSDATVISLSDDGITVDGSAVSTDESAAVYTANDIIYYEDRDTYDDGYTYGAGTDADKHTAEEAAANTVVHITEAGTYILSGELSAGQIFVDLGEDAETDPDAVVTLVFAGADIICEVAPAVLFYRVYECDTAWTAYDNGDADSYTESASQDTSAAGASVIIADGTINNVNGSYVAKIYKDNADQKKKYKFDGAFYSRMSMNIDGEDDDSGVLNITAENEGLDSELHLTINGGTININSQDDGINTNEDNVSVTTINGGSLHIVAGLGDEGDGIDSNGYLVINGGVVIATANPAADSGLDSDLGSYINGGYVVATGSTMDWPESESDQVTMNLQFASMQDSDEAVIITDTDGNVVFAYDPDKDEATGSNNRSYQGMVISCPDFQVGETYHVYVGGDVTGTDVNGLYDASTVTGFSGATQQEYTGTDVGGMMPGGDQGEGMTPPDGEQSGDMPTPPSGDQGGQMTPPDGEQGEGMTPPDGEGGQMPDGQNSGTTGSASTEFYMTDKVNAFSGVADVGTTVVSGLPFTDVQTGDWFYSNVEYVYNQSLFKGTSETTFEPQTSMSRAMLWCVIARMNDADSSDGETWYSTAQAWTMANGISDGTNPTNNVTREQIVTMLWRLSGEPESSQDVSSFSDSANVSNYAQTAVKWAVENGILRGDDQGQLNPKNDATRAEVAALIQRYCELNS